MAQKTVVTMTDDIDGSEGTETVTFALDGTTYEIDLNTAHAEDLREVLAPFVAVARQSSGRTGRTPGRTPGRIVSNGGTKARAANDVDPKAVRAWAEANGIEVNARGRLKADIIKQYKAVN